MDSNPRFRGTPELRFRVLVNGDAKARKEKHSPGVHARCLKTVINVQKLHIL